MYSPFCYHVDIIYKYHTLSIGLFVFHIFVCDLLFHVNTNFSRIYEACVVKAYVKVFLFLRMSLKSRKSGTKSKKIKDKQATKIIMGYIRRLSKNHNISLRDIHFVIKIYCEFIYRAFDRKKCSQRIKIGGRYSNVVSRIGSPVTSHCVYHSKWIDSELNGSITFKIGDIQYPEWCSKGIIVGLVTCDKLIKRNCFDNINNYGFRLNGTKYVANNGWTRGGFKIGECASIELNLNHKTLTFNPGKIQYKMINKGGDIKYKFAVCFGNIDYGYNGRYSLTLTDIVDNLVA